MAVLNITDAPYIRNLLSFQRAKREVQH